ncbi:unnamed protein product [Calypogeia fissa]
MIGHGLRLRLAVAVVIHLGRRFLSADPYPVEWTWRTRGFRSRLNLEAALNFAHTRLCSNFEVESCAGGAENS